jgi:hypothetical protein
MVNFVHALKATPYNIRSSSYPLCTCRYHRKCAWLSTVLEDYKNTGQLPGANPLGNRKKPWETQFCQWIFQGRALGMHLLANVLPGVIPLWNFPGAHPCQICQGLTPVKQIGRPATTDTFCVESDDFSPCYARETSIIFFKNEFMFPRGKTPRITRTEPIRQITWRDICSIPDSMFDRGLPFADFIGV